MPIAPSTMSKRLLAKTIKKLNPGVRKQVKEIYYSYLGLSLYVWIKLELSVYSLECNSLENILFLSYFRLHYIIVIAFCPVLKKKKVLFVYVHFVCSNINLSIFFNYQFIMFCFISYLYIISSNMFLKYPFLKIIKSGLYV